MKKSFCIVLLLFVFLCACYGDIVLTVDSAADMALEGNRTLKQQEMSYIDKERSSKNRWNVFLPDITASAGVGRGNKILKDSPDPVWNGKVSGAVSLTLGTDIPHKMARIREEYEAGNIDYENAKRNLEVTVRQAFYELLIYQRDMDLVKSNLDANKKRYEQAEERYRNGLVPELDVLNASLAWTKLIPQYDSLSTAYERKLDQFKISLGIDSNEKVILDGNLDDFIPQDVDLDSIPEDFETPELKSLKASLRVAESNQKELKGSSLMPEITLGWSITPTWDDLSYTNEYVDKGGFSATILWHLDNLIPNSSGNLKIKQLSDASEKLRLKIAEEEVDSVSQVENLVRRIRQQQESVKTLELTAQIAKRSLDLTEEAYKYGTKDMLDVSDAQQTMREAEMDILKEKFDIFCSILELEYKLNLSFGTLGR